MFWAEVERTFVFFKNNEFYHKALFLDFKVKLLTRRS